MIPNDVLALGPFILAVVVALAVLVADLVAPGKKVPVLAVSLVVAAMYRPTPARAPDVWRSSSASVEG